MKSHGCSNSLNKLKIIYGCLNSLNKLKIIYGEVAVDDDDDSDSVDHH